MPQLSEHKSQALTKLLVIGDGGSGKTGGLASLAAAGYNLFVLDFDDGMDVLVSVCREQKIPLDRISYELCKNKMKPDANFGARLDGVPQGMAHAMKCLDNWPGKGPLSQWTDKDVLVIDSLTHMGTAAMQHVLALVGREGKAQLQDWGAAMDIVEKVIQLVTSPIANCNVVINTHVNYTESAEGSGVIKGYPMALGNKLSPKIGTYFNTVLVLKSVGSGDSRKREYKTKGEGLIDGKASAIGAPASLPHATGLADFFKLAKGQKV